MHLPKLRLSAASWGVVALVAAWFVVINIFALLAWHRFNLSPDTAYGWIDSRHLHSAAWSLSALPARWDSEWYLSIARDGYSYRGPGELSNIVFFPVYPLLVSVVGVLFGGNLVLAGWVVSLLGLMTGAVLLAKLVREFHPKIDAEEAVWILLIFPTAIFFNAVYTEGLFLAESVAVMYLARRRVWGWAAVLAAAAALTRVTGVLLLVPLLMEAWAEWRETRRWRLSWAGLAAIPAACASFFAFHWWRFGDPWLFFKLEKAWGRGFVVNGEHFQAATGAAQANLALDVFFVVLALAASVAIWRKLRPSYAAYALVGLLVPLASGTLMSVGRYILVLFPIPIVLAALPPRLRKVWCLASVLLLGLYVMLFAHSYWAG